MRKQSISKAFINAFNGMRYFFLHERNGKIQIAIAALVVASAVGLGVPTMHVVIVLLCVAMVIGAEMVNCAVENLCNMVQEEYHPVIKVVKDVAAGAVLLIALTSTAIGLYIFLPKVFELIA